MATVYLAQDLKHGRRVAVKVLRAELTATMGTERFLREIGIAATLAHPHILPLHDSGEAAGSLYYVMPFVDGETLRARIQRERQLPLDDALRIADEVADALAYANSHGVIHRDIKPENILLDGDHAMVADFGIARVLTDDAATRLTGTGLAVGTAGYMSPEQASGQPVDQRTDVYALAAVLYEMLAGEKPHAGPTPQAILARALSEAVRPLTKVRESVPAALDFEIRKALSRVPADRHASAADFKAALRVAITAPHPLSATQDAVPSRDRQRRVRAALVTLAALAVVAGIALIYQMITDNGGERRLGFAVFPFRATVARADQYTEQLPDLLATVLDGTPGVRVADPWALWGPLRASPGARARSPVDLQAADRMARKAQAGIFLLGSIQMDEAGDERSAIAVTARLYRVGSQDAFHTVTDSAPPDSIGALAHRIAVAVITRALPGSAVGVPELEGFTTTSPDAIKAYLRAKEATRRGQVDSADAEIDAALRADTTFALGMVEAVRIKSWVAFLRGQPFFGLVNLLDRAEKYADSLSLRNRLRLQAARASVRTEGAEAVALTRQILAIDSTDLDAWMGLSYYHRAYGWQYGGTDADATAALERVIALDSNHVPALTSLALELQLSDDPRGALYGEMLRRADTTSLIARSTLLSGRLLAMPDSVYARFVDTLAQYDTRLLIPALRPLRTHRPDRAMALLERLRLRQGPGIPDFRAEWARMLAAQGRFRALDSAVNAGAFATPLLPRWFLVSSQLALTGDSSLSAASATFLDRMMPPDSALAMFQRMPVWVNGWNVAAHNAAFGDTAVTRRWQKAIGTLPSGGTSSDYRGSLQADLESRLLARRGDRAAALASSARAYDLWSIHTENAYEFQPEPGMRFHFAMLLRSAGKVDSARALLRSLVPPTSWLGFLTARSALELARLEEEQGDRASALVHYSMANRLYRTADPSLAALRDQAREGLERMTGERARP